MEVRMKVRVSGTRDGAPWPDAGESLTLPATEAAAYCALGIAEPIGTVSEEVRETAVLTTTNVTKRVTRARKADA